MLGQGDCRSRRLRQRLSPVPMQALQIFSRKPRGTHQAPERAQMPFHLSPSSQSRCTESGRRRPAFNAASGTRPEKDQHPDPQTPRRTQREDKDQRRNDDEQQRPSGDRDMQPMGILKKNLPSRQPTPRRPDPWTAHQKTPHRSLKTLQTR